MPDRYIARQPIFNTQLRVFGYELLFRASPKNIYEPRAEASTSIIVDSTMLFDLQALTGPAKAFVNLDEPALLRGAARLLPPDRVVLELLETISITPEVIQACRNLREAGYELALDDVICPEKLGPLLDVAHFLKVDFRATDVDTRRSIAQHFLPRGMSLIAEKVETQGEVNDARNLGYAYYQGFFFCKPAMVSQRDIPANKLNYLRLLEAVAVPELEDEKIEEILKQDPSLTYKLLRYLNSPILGLRGTILDIRHGISLLGEDEFRRWVSIVAIAAMAGDKPGELIRTALTRAYFCEQVAALVGLADRKAQLFLLGLLSVIDALLDVPMSQILVKLPVHNDLRTALLGGSNHFRQVQDLLLAYEQGKWSNVAEIAAQLGVTEENVAKSYLFAVNKTDAIFQSQPVKAV